VPLFAASQGHNYGLQLADLITTVIALRFQSEDRIMPLWNMVYKMFDMQQVGGRRVSSLRVMRYSAQTKRDPAALLRAWTAGIVPTQGAVHGIAGHCGTACLRES
jgi:hypothetical protein